LALTGCSGNEGGSVATSVIVTGDTTDLNTKCIEKGSDDIVVDVCKASGFDQITVKATLAKEALEVGNNTAWSQTLNQTGVGFDAENKGIPAGTKLEVVCASDIDAFGVVFPREYEGEGRINDVGEWTTFRVEANGEKAQFQPVGFIHMSDFEDAPAVRDELKAALEKAFGEGVSSYNSCGSSVTTVATYKKKFAQGEIQKGVKDAG
jgi:hypothetical protein